jgi:GT2 family glycosyltransferase
VAIGEVLAFVDADHTIDAMWLIGAAAALRDPTVAAVGAPCDAPNTGSWVQRMYGTLRGHASGSREATWVGSGNMAVRRGVFRQIGGFDTTLETCEDVDLCQRLRAAGYRLTSDERLKSTHLGDPSTIRALFVGELWRGRDNLRSAFRRVPALRDLPSILVPLVNLSAFTVVVGGLFTLPNGWKLISGGVAIFVATAALRTSRMMTRGAGWTVPNVWRAFIVAAVYDAARALALVMRAPHHRVRRQKSI